MIDVHPRSSKACLECARLLGLLHAKIRGGDGDSPEADELRDQMDVHWAQLTPEEIEQMRRLSADLGAAVRTEDA
jgi:hypothetical protein